jgi:hypothetical protein
MAVTSSSTAVHGRVPFRPHRQRVRRLAIIHLFVQVKTKPVHLIRQALTKEKSCGKRLYFVHVNSPHAQLITGTIQLLAVDGLRQEAGPSIRVAMVSPGFVATDFIDSFPDAES